MVRRSLVLALPVCDHHGRAYGHPVKVFDEATRYPGGICGGSCVVCL
jgi:hypothetical protein